MPDYLGLTDSTLPATSKPSSQQYDPYSIYDIHCVDIRSTTNTGTEIVNATRPGFYTIAVQAYHPTPILCNFNQIIRDYP